MANRKIADRTADFAAAADNREERRGSLGDGADRA